MKMRNVLWLALAMLVVFGLPATAEQAVQENAEVAVCSAAVANVETIDAEAAAPTEAITDGLPPVDFLGVGICNCTVGQDCTVPCISADQTPVCLNVPCLSTNAAINGVCTCV